MKARSGRLIVTIILMLLALAANAQNFPCLHFTTTEGLPSNTVYSVYRDSKGLLWFATDKGIACYNGLHFEAYTTTNGLADNEVFFIQEDYDHRLWMGTYNGELCYYKDGIFHTAKNTPFLNIPIKTSFTKYISLEADSSVTISYYNGEKFLNIKGNKANIYTTPSLEDDILRNDVIRKKKLAGGMFYIEANALGVTIDSNSNLIEQHKRPHKDRVLSTFCQGQEYLYNKSAIYSLNGIQVSDLPGKLPLMTSIYKIYANKQNLLVCTNNGLYINDSIHVFKENRVSSVTQDLAGNYWITTLKNGIYTFPENLNNRVFANVYNGEVVFGANDKKTNYYLTDRADIYSFSGDRNARIFNYNKYKHVPENTVYQNITFNITANDLFLYNYSSIIIIKNISANHTQLNKEKLSDKYATFEGRNICVNGNDIYLLRPAGMLLLNKENILNDPIIKNISFTKWGTKDRIFTMTKMQDNSILYSTLDKVYKIVDKKISVPEQLKNISFKRFYSFDNYLVGYTHYNKLIVCHNFESDVNIDSIPDQNCVWDKLYQLDKTHILISTNNLYRVLTLPSALNTQPYVYPAENQFLPIDAEHIFVDSGNCYFLKNGDITKISINEVLATTREPSLFFKGLKTANNKYSIDSVLSLSYGEARNLTIKVSFVNYSGKNVSFQYSFSKNGYDNWRNMTNEEINVINSDYGTFFVKVRAKTPSSPMSKPIQFKLVIARPYWATWWFLLLCGTLILSVTALIIRYRLDLAFKKNRIDHQKEIRYIKSEYKALNALMNPHFIFNTLNNVQSLINKDEKRAANEYLRIFANLIRQNMHNTSLELITLHEEMDLVSNYLKLEKLRYKELLNYEICIDEKTDINDIMIPPLLIQPLVENSIKHGLFPRKSLDNFISIHIYEQDNVLTIMVKDNGIGLTEAKSKTAPEHKSFGLENIRKRIHHASVIQNREITLQIKEKTDEHGLQWTVVMIEIELPANN